MNKYLGTLIFYVVSFVVIYGLNIISPGQPDGGPGWGSFAVVILVLSALVLTIFNAYKGFKTSKDYFILAGVHLLVVMVMVFTLFL